MKPAVREELIVKDRAVKNPTFDSLLREVLLFSKTILFIGCGAVATIWEGVEKLIKTTCRKKTHDAVVPRMSEKISPGPDKIKIPLLPIDNYNQLPASQIVRKLKDLSAGQLRLLRDFETGHKNQETVLKAIDTLLKTGKSCE
ncbi:MAG: hypothetical protein ACYDBV_02190 [Nitrospiria bacterium]